MIILGLDPGTATTGYGIIKKERGALTCIAFGCIYTSSGLELAKRLDILRRELLSIIKKYKPDHSAIRVNFLYIVMLIKRFK